MSENTLVIKTNNNFPPHNKTYWVRNNVVCKNHDCKYTKDLSPAEITNAGIAHHGYGYCSKCYKEMKKKNRLPQAKPNKEFQDLLLAWQEYNHYYELYRRAIVQTQTHIVDFMNDMNLSKKILYTSWRIKTFESIKAKCNRRKKKYKTPFLDMEDIAGIRFICMDQRSVEEIRAGIKNLFGTLVIKNEIIKNRKLGYEALHLVISAKPFAFGTQYSVPVEIQIRTTGQDAFANMSESYAYKIPKEYLPRDWEKNIRKLSRRFKSVEKDIDKIGSKWRKHCIASKKLDIIDPSTIIELCRKRLDFGMNEDEAFDIYRRLRTNNFNSIATIDGLLANRETRKKLAHFLSNAGIPSSVKFTQFLLCSEKGEEYTNSLLNEYHKLFPTTNQQPSLLTSNSEGSN